MTTVLIAAAVVVALIAFKVIQSRGSHGAATGLHGELGVGQGSASETADTTQTRDTSREERRGGCC